VNGQHPVRLSIDYPDRDLNRLTPALRIFTGRPTLCGALVRRPRSDRGGDRSLVRDPLHRPLPRGMFDYIEGAFILVTDRYPRFRLRP
jgi:hypothetical protein